MRRHITPCGVKRDNTRSPGRVNIPVRKSRVIINKKKLVQNPAQALELLGLTVDSLKNKEHKSRSSKDSEVENNDRSSTGTLIGYDECNLVCHSHSTSVLLTPTDGTIKYPRGELIVL